MSANEQQVGGSHYKAKVQHWDICGNFDIPYILGCMTKYLYRYPEKNGAEDLSKALHYAMKWEEITYSDNPTPYVRNRVVNYIQLNIMLQEFASSFHKDVAESIKELAIDILYSWDTMPKEKFAYYKKVIEEVIANASNN